MQIKLILAILFITACTNPFSTRDPEPPETGGNVQAFEDARDPEQLLLNFERAVEEKNITEYINCFANPSIGHQKRFRFQPEPNLVDYFIDSWTLRDEENYFRRVTEEERVSYPRLTFNTLDEPVLRPLNVAAPDDSMETNIFRYQLTVAEVDTQKIYTGQMKLRVFQSRATDSNWYIYHWDDYAVDEKFESTWSFLKFENR